MDPGGERAWVLDSQWVENGGGIYSVKIGCDGALTDEGMVVPAKLAYAMALLPDGSGRAAVFAKTMLDSPVGKDTHLLAWGLAPKLLAGAAAFPDDDAIVSSMAVTPDSKVILIADNNEFSENSNRVAVLGLSGDTLSPKTVLTGVNDPVALVASPFGNAAIAVSGYGNSIIRLSIAPGAEPPAKVEGPLTWSGKKPQLPGAAVMVAVGKLSGLVLVAENMGVRRVRFEPDGQVTDLGMTAVGDGKGLDEIVGAIGVQP
jgi:hypothetical protein